MEHVSQWRMDVLRRTLSVHTTLWKCGRRPVSREKRKNTDVQTFRAEAGLYGNFSDKEQWRLKAYYFQSSRGLPKATTFYNDHSTTPVG